MIRKSLTIIHDIVSFEFHRKQVVYFIIVVALFRFLATLPTIIHSTNVRDIALSIAISMKFPSPADLIMLIFLYYAISTFITDRDLKQTVLSLPVSRRAYIISLYVYVVFVTVLLWIITLDFTILWGLLGNKTLHLLGIEIIKASISSLDILTLTSIILLIALPVSGRHTALKTMIPLALILYAVGSIALYSYCESVDPTSTSWIIAHTVLCILNPKYITLYYIAQVDSVVKKALLMSRTYALIFSSSSPTSITPPESVMGILNHLYPCLLLIILLLIIATLILYDRYFEVK